MKTERLRYQPRGLSLIQDPHLISTKFEPPLSVAPPFLQFLRQLLPSNLHSPLPQQFRTKNTNIAKIRYPVLKIDITTANMYIRFNRLNPLAQSENNST